MFASSILHPIFKQDNMFECIKVIILPTTTNSLFKDLINKSIYVDLKSLILLHKSHEKLQRDDIVRLNAQINGLSHLLDCKISDPTLILAEPFNFNSLLEIESMEFSAQSYSTIDDFNTIESLKSEKTITRSNHESDDSINNSNLAGTDKQGDETLSQKLDKLLDQNIEIYDLLINVNNKYEIVSKQIESIIANQEKHDHLYEIAIKNYQQATNIELNKNSRVNTRQSTSHSSYFGSEEDNTPDIKIEYARDGHKSFDDKTHSSSSASNAKKPKQEETYEHDYSQKEFNNYAKKFLKEVFSDLDSFEDLSEIQNKFPEKIHQIKGRLKPYVPKDINLNLAWSKLQHTFRQQKYMKKKESNKK